MQHREQRDCNERIPQGLAWAQGLELWGLAPLDAFFFFFADFLFLRHIKIAIVKGDLEVLPNTKLDKCDNYAASSSLLLKQMKTSWKAFFYSSPDHCCLRELVGNTKIIS